MVSPEFLSSMAFKSFPVLRRFESAIVPDKELSPYLRGPFEAADIRVYRDGELLAFRRLAATRSRRQHRMASVPMYFAMNGREWLRHPGEQTCGGRHGRDARRLAKAFCEVALVRESHRDGDLRQGLREVVDSRCRRRMNADGPQIMRRQDAEKLLESTIEMGRGKASDAGHLRHRDHVGEMFLDKAARQAAVLKSACVNFLRFFNLIHRSPRGRPLRRGHRTAASWSRNTSIASRKPDSAPARICPDSVDRLAITRRSSAMYASANNGG